MPFYFVEGFQHDKPCEPLLIHADSEESAKTQARQWGMVVTGVRGAEEKVVPKSNIRRSDLMPQVGFYFHVYAPVIMILIFVFGVEANDNESMAALFPLMFVSCNFAIVFQRMHTMSRQQSKTIELLVAEVKDLRSIVVQQKVSPDSSA